MSQKLDMTNVTDGDLLGYLLDALEAGERKRVAVALEHNDPLRARLEEQQQALEPLAADRDHTEPPPGLAVRTLACIAAHSYHELPRAPALPRTTPSPGRPFWRRADVLVAATVLLTVVGFALTRIYVARQDAALISCQANLRTYGQALFVYRDRNGNQFPNITTVNAPAKAAGLVFPVLIKAQALPRDANVHCPGKGPPRPVKWTLEELQRMDPDEFQRYAHELAPTYAYAFPYQSGSQVVGWRYDPDKPNAFIPIMADSPLDDATAGNSLNHGGKGQNVLFLDGHVKFCTTRTAGVEGDDIYVNKLKKVMPGIDWKDSVLGNCAATP
jgi:prepilin-type processing-associated H-X9-DG protein